MNLQTFGKLSEKPQFSAVCAKDVVKAEWLKTAVVRASFWKNRHIRVNGLAVDWKTAPPPQPAQRMRQNAAERAVTPLSRGVSAIVGREMRGVGDTGAVPGARA